MKRETAENLDMGFISKASILVPSFCESYSKIIFRKHTKFIVGLYYVSKI